MQLVRPRSVFPLRFAPRPGGPPLTVWHGVTRSTSQLCLAGELAASVCVSPARPESDGGARPESVHPSVGKNSQVSRLPPGHTALPICLSRREGKGPGSELRGDVRRQQLHQLFKSVQLKVIWIQQRAPNEAVCYCGSSGRAASVQTVTWAPFAFDGRPVQLMLKYKLGLTLCRDVTAWWITCQK